jgi:hypothetical protein
MLSLATVSSDVSSGQFWYQDSLLASDGTHWSHKVGGRVLSSRVRSWSGVGCPSRFSGLTRLRWSGCGHGRGAAQLVVLTAHIGCYSQLNEVKQVASSDRAVAQVGVRSQSRSLRLRSVLDSLTNLQAVVAFGLRTKPVSVRSLSPV